MPVAKLLATSTPDAMKADEGNDALDTFTRQAVGKEPSFSFSRTGETPVQWIQLLHALDQQDLPGWPLLAPLKVQMQKCEKCAQEFCSTINYRRHIRVHRRSFNIYKEPQRNKDLLGAFWDKLSLDEAKEIMSFKDVTLEEVPGSSIVRAITSNLRKPGFHSLPQVYMKAGNALLDMIQGRLSRFPVSSPELFSILDDASERTFLCAGTAESMQKYVFDGEAGKIGLEMRNLIACASFLVEQKLMKAWLADKDAEALRCQKLLVEEEEAARRRQAELLERKRQRKLRQKEQRAKESSGEKVDLYIADDTLKGTLPAETSDPPVSAEFNSDAQEILENHVLEPLDSVQNLNNEECMDIEAGGGCSSEHSDSGAGQNIEPQKVQGSGFQHFNARWQLPKLQKGGRNGFHSNQNVHPLKRETTHKHGNHKDQRGPLANGGKIWTKKPKSDNSGELVRNRVQNDATNQTDQSNCQLMIGSISVTVRNSTGQHQGHERADVEENGITEIKKNSAKLGANRPSVKLWRRRHDATGQLQDRNGHQILEEDDVTSEKGADQTRSVEICNQSCDSNESEGTSYSHPLVEDGAQPEGVIFSSDAAKAFLAQRWKEAVSGDHVKLVLSAEQTEPPGNLNLPNNHQVPDPRERMVLVSAENRLGNDGHLESSVNGNVKPKLRTKPEKGVKSKYIPKQRTVN